MMSLKKKIGIIIFSIFFILILINVLLNNTSLLDRSVYNFIINLQSENMTNFFKIITELGGVIFTIVVCILSLIFFKKKGLYFCIDIVSVVLINNILKNIIMRPRPVGLNLIKESGYSFPSGHTMNSCALYGFIIYLVLKSTLNKYLKILLVFICSLIILLVMTSRIYLGVHYFTDVFAGLMISIIWLLFYTEYIDNKKIY